MGNLSSISVCCFQREKNIVSGAKKCMVVTTLACSIPANIIIITLKTRIKEKNNSAMSCVELFRSVGEP